MSNIYPWDIARNPRRDAALQYAAIGWHVLPVWWIEDGQCACGTKDCKNAGKHPINALVRHGKDNATTDVDTIKEWWKEYPKANVAVDAEKSHLVVVDVDPRNGGLATKEILEEQHGLFSSEVMQFSGGGGEHWIYHRPSAVSSLPGKLGPGVDLKLNGYFLAEPSNHISGGSYAWEGSSNPTEGEIPSPLPDWIRSLSVVTPVAHRLHQEQGCRYATQETIDDLRDALTHLDADDRDQWVRFGLALAPLGQAGFTLWDEWSQTSNKYDPVDAIRVWRSCKPGEINHESIFFAAQAVGWLNPASVGSKPEPPTMDDMPDAAEATPIPADILDPPFTQLRATVDWLDKYSIKTNRMISVVGALSIAQGATARVFRSKQHSNPTTWFTGIVAATGAGKDYVRQAYSAAFIAAGYPDMVGKSGYSSGAGLRDTLLDNPKGVSFLDEFGDLIAHGVNDRGGPKRDLFTTLRKAFNTGPLESIGFAKGAGREADKVVVDPCLGLVGLTTRGQFVGAINDSMMADGTLNRFVIIDATHPPQRNRVPGKTPPDWLISHIAQLRKSVDAVGNLASMSASNPDAAVWYHLPFSDAAMDYLDQIGDHEDPDSLIGIYSSRGEVEAQACVRWREIAMRMATCLSAYERHTQIEQATVEWCYRFVSHFGDQFVAMYEAEANQSEYGQLRDAFLQKIRSYGPGGATKKRLAGDRPFRGVPRTQREQILADLVEAGQIVFTKESVDHSDKPVTTCFAAPYKG